MSSNAAEQVIGGKLTGLLADSTGGTDGDGAICRRDLSGA